MAGLRSERIVKSLLVFKNENKLYGRLYQGKDDGCQERQQEDDDRDVAMAHVVDGGRGEATVEEAVDTPTYECSPEESDGDVAGIVNAQIETRPAVDQRIADEGDDQQAATHEQREEEGDAERVGRMGREEAVIATAIAIDHIDQRTNLGVVGRTPASHKGLDNGVVDSSCQEHTEACRGQHEQHLAKPTVGLQHDVEQSQIEGYPRTGIGQRHDDIVEEHGVAAIQRQQQLFVEVYQFFHSLNDFNLLGFQPSFLTVGHANLLPSTHRAIGDVDLCALVEDEEVGTAL